jgi:hypothetical protein
MALAMIEVCGLLADGQTCMQLVNWESAATAACPPLVRVAGGWQFPSKVTISVACRQGEVVLKFVRSGNKATQSLVFDC